jgi:hypothetical protein
VSALEQAAAGPSLEDRLREVLPSWTHWSRSIFGGFTATWTTTDGTWSIGDGSSIQPWAQLEGPGGKWAFARKDADHIIGVLRSLGAIVEGNPEPPLDNFREVWSTGGHP